MFWQNYVRLCEEVGKAPSRVAVECGLSNAITTGWKRGAVPQERYLRKLASYFGVSVEDLLSDDSGMDTNARINNASDERMLLDLFNSFNREGRGRLLDYAESMKRSGMYDPNVDYFLKGFDADE